MRPLKIVLACAGGMSTSLFCKKIVQQAEKKGFSCECDAFGVSSLDDKLLEGVDVVLLAPQVRFYHDEMSAKFPNVPFEHISMQDYGMVNGAAVFDQLQKKFDWQA